MAPAANGPLICGHLKQTSNRAAEPVALLKTNREALPDSLKELSHANVACTEQNLVRLGASVAESEELKEKVYPPVAVEAGLLRNQSQPRASNNRQKTYVWPSHKLQASVPAMEHLRHDAKVTAAQHGAAPMDAVGCPLASLNAKSSPGRPGEIRVQAVQEAMTASRVTVDPYRPSPPVSLRFTGCGTTKL